ncbi:hypothetical protein [Paenibacillus sp. sgz5001063]|uniref:hypothetical protein n=1 Tax=Paenibacillus sp. sgz5001063 TaxID=3242474 RepID=UPI0036D2F260
MKILFIYAVLALLGLSIAISVDWLTGTPLSMSFNFLNSIFITTTFEELVVIILFFFLPFIQQGMDAYKRKKKTGQ